MSSDGPPAKKQRIMKPMPIFHQPDQSNESQSTPTPESEGFQVNQGILPVIGQILDSFDMNGRELCVSGSAAVALYARYAGIDEYPESHDIDVVAFKARTDRRDMRRPNGWTSLQSPSAKSQTFSPSAGNPIRYEVDVTEIPVTTIPSPTMIEGIPVILIKKLLEFYEEDVGREDRDREKIRILKEIIAKHPELVEPEKPIVSSQFLTGGNTRFAKSLSKSLF